MFLLLCVTTLANEETLIYHQFVYKYLQSHPEYTNGLHIRAYNNILNSEYFEHYRSYYQSYPDDFVNRSFFGDVFRKNMFRIAFKYSCDCGLIVYRLQYYISSFPNFRQYSIDRFFNICPSLYVYSYFVDFFPINRTHENNHNVESYIERCDKLFHYINTTSISY